MLLTFALCTFNRAARLEKLVGAMRRQTCPIPFEILAVNNNSTDNTPQVLEALQAQPGAPLRWVTEATQGIVAARNRAVEESLASDIMVFIDDDELPQPGLLDAAARAILDEGADCVGGRIEIDFSNHSRPAWLDDELLGFLGAANHGDNGFWIKDKTTPVWTGNVGYAMHIFRNHPDLRFDKRYDRKGAGVGGGSDAIMFRTLIDRKFKIRYSPEMVVLHDVDSWRLQRGYFLRLHYRAGVKHGRFQLPGYAREVFGIPPFLAVQCIRQGFGALTLQIAGRPGALRKAMNAAHAFGCAVGYSRRGEQP